MHYIILRQEEFITLELKLGIRFSDWVTWPMNLIAVKVKDFSLAERLNEVARGLRAAAA